MGYEMYLGAIKKGTPKNQYQYSNLTQKIKFRKDTAYTQTQTERHLKDRHTHTQTHTHTHTHTPTHIDRQTYTLTH